MSSTLYSALLRHQGAIYTALRQAVLSVGDEAAHSGITELQSFYGQMQYHLGWVDRDFNAVKSNPGKLLRPTLLLLAYEAAGAWGQTPTSVDDNSYLYRALPAAAAIELTHNFTLIHDDIEDNDAERRHRPTAWSIWGIPQAINTGDGMFALARLTLWVVLEAGVEGCLAARLGSLLDRACLILAEGQHLDMCFEWLQQIPVSTYIDMISRKTAALMRCAAEMGALLGTRDEETIERLRSFGWAIGIAFQVRDDMLGVWASTDELGKLPAGDIYRRKKSLPILYALEHATPVDQQRLRMLYGQETPLTPEQVEDVLTIFGRTRTQTYCRTFLIQHCCTARVALAQVPRNDNPISARALSDMEALVDFVEEIAIAPGDHEGPSICIS
jgi:geranylgeranyl diphosphate synthase type I